MTSVSGKCQKMWELSHDVLNLHQWNSDRMTFLISGQCQRMWGLSHNVFVYSHQWVADNMTTVSGKCERMIGLSHNAKSQATLNGTQRGGECQSMWELSHNVSYTSTSGSQTVISALSQVSVREWQRHILLSSSMNLDPLDSNLTVSVSGECHWAVSQYFIYCHQWISDTRHNSYCAFLMEACNWVKGLLFIYM